MRPRQAVSHELGGVGSSSHPKQCAQYRQRCYSTQPRVECLMNAIHDPHVQLDVGSPCTFIASRVDTVRPVGHDPRPHPCSSRPKGPRPGVARQPYNTQRSRTAAPCRMQRKEQMRAAKDRTDTHRKLDWISISRRTCFSTLFSTISDLYRHLRATMYRGSHLVRTSTLR